MKADIRWLDDPQVFRVNRLDAHSDHKFYENKEDYDWLTPTKASKFYFRYFQTRSSSLSLS